jgi:hypothetical protein
MMAEPVYLAATVGPVLREKKTTHSPMELRRLLPDRLTFLLLQKKKHLG